MEEATQARRAFEEGGWSASQWLPHETDELLVWLHRPPQQNLLVSLMLPMLIATRCQRMLRYFLAGGKVRVLDRYAGELVGVQHPDFGRQFTFSSGSAVEKALSTESSGMLIVARDQKLARLGAERRQLSVGVLNVSAEVA